MDHGSIEGNPEESAVILVEMWNPEETTGQSGHFERQRVKLCLRDRDALSLPRTGI